MAQDVPPNTKHHPTEMEQPGLQGSSRKVRALSKPRPFPKREVSAAQNFPTKPGPGAVTQR